VKKLVKIFVCDRGLSGFYYLVGVRNWKQQGLGMDGLNMQIKFDP